MRPDNSTAAEALNHDRIDACNTLIQLASLHEELKNFPGLDSMTEKRAIYIIEKTENPSEVVNYGGEYFLHHIPSLRSLIISKYLEHYKQDGIFSSEERAEYVSIIGKRDLRSQFFLWRFLLISILCLIVSVAVLILGTKFIVTHVHGGGRGLLVPHYVLCTAMIAVSSQWIGQGIRNFFVKSPSFRRDEIRVLFLR